MVYECTLICGNDLPATFYYIMYEKYAKLKIALVI